MTLEEQKAVVYTIGKLIDSIYVFPEVAKEATVLLKEKEGKGVYSSITIPEEFARTLTKDLISNDLHISVKFDPEAVAEEKKQKTKTNLDKATGTLERLRYACSFLKTEKK